MDNTTEGGVSRPGFGWCGLCGVELAVDVADNGVEVCNGCLDVVLAEPAAARWPALRVLSRG